MDIGIGLPATIPGTLAGLTLGLGVGGRADDFLAAPAGFQDRGKRFDAQLALMQRVWAGQPLSDAVGPVGPPPARPTGPEILIGGSSTAALSRLGRYGNGFIAGSADPPSAQRLFTAAQEVWQAAGRAGKPRFVGGLYYALGPDAATRGGDYLRHYYRFLGPIADRIAANMLTSPAALQTQIQAFQAIGMDELIAWPCIAELNQVDRLAEIVG